MSNTHAQREIPFVLTGYSNNTTSGVARVVEFDRKARIARAGRGLFMAWAAATASVFIPVAHFLLVPAFTIGGVAVFASRIRAVQLTNAIVGSCPDCGVDQDFGSAGRWDPPHTLHCRACRRSLTARSAKDTAS